MALRGRNLVLPKINLSSRLSAVSSNVGRQRRWGAGKKQKLIPRENMEARKRSGSKVPRSFESHTQKARPQILRSARMTGLQLDGHRLSCLWVARRAMGTPSVETIPPELDHAPWGGRQWSGLQLVGKGLLDHNSNYKPIKLAKPPPGLVEFLAVAFSVFRARPVPCRLSHAVWRAPELHRRAGQTTGGLYPCRFAAGFSLCRSPLLFCRFAQAQQAPYLDTKLSPAERAHDLVGRMTLEEKADQLEDWATAIPRLGIPDYQTWNEALHGVARAGYSTVFPAGHRHGRHLGPGDGPRAWAT